jgi:hypothetical protein
MPDEDMGTKNLIVTQEPTRETLGEGLVAILKVCIDEKEVVTSEGNEATTSLELAKIR